MEIEPRVRPAVFEQQGTGERCDPDRLLNIIDQGDRVGSTVQGQRRHGERPHDVDDNRDPGRDRARPIPVNEVVVHGSMSCWLTGVRVGRAVG